MSSGDLRVHLALLGADGLGGSHAGCSGHGSGKERLLGGLNVLLRVHLVFYLLKVELARCN